MLTLVFVVKSLDEALQATAEIPSLPGLRTLLVLSDEAIKDELSNADQNLSVTTMADFPAALQRIGGGFVAFVNESVRFDEFLLRQALEQLHLHQQLDIVLFECGAVSGGEEGVAYGITGDFQDQLQLFLSKPEAVSMFNWEILRHVQLKRDYLLSSQLLEVHTLAFEVVQSPDKHFALLSGPVCAFDVQRRRQEVQFGELRETVAQIAQENSRLTKTSKPQWKPVVNLKQSAQLFQLLQRSYQMTRPQQLHLCKTALAAEFAGPFLRQLPENTFLEQICPGVELIRPRAALAAGNVSVLIFVESDDADLQYTNGLRNAVHQKPPQEIIVAFPPALSADALLYLQRMQALHPQITLLNCSNLSKARCFEALANAGSRHYAAFMRPGDAFMTSNGVERLQEFQTDAACADVAEVLTISATPLGRAFDSQPGLFGCVFRKRVLRSVLHANALLENVANPILFEDVLAWLLKRQSKSVKHTKEQIYLRIWRFEPREWLQQAREYSAEAHALQLEATGARTAQIFGEAAAHNAKRAEPENMHNPGLEPGTP